MSTPRIWLQRALIILTAGIGLYMSTQFAWLTPPSLSGVAFILIALALWVPHCPLLGLLINDKGKRCDS